MQGQQFGPYRLMTLLGQGGQSVVWRALDIRTNHSIALKVLRPGLAGPSDIARLKREAALLASFSDPGLPRGYDLYDDGVSTPALAMEFIEGTSLSSLLTSQRPGPIDALLMGRELARIVSVLHGKGLAHRDIKPSNIMLRPGRQPGQPGSIVLVDLGIARGSKKHATSYTETGVSIGTPAFMPPEALLSLARDEQAPAGDVFAIGVLLWSVLTGRHPTGLPMSASWLELRDFYSRHQAVTLDSSMRPRLDAVVPGLSSVVARCVDPSLNNRFSGAAQLQAALSSLGGGWVPQTGPPPSTPRSAGDWTGMAVSARPAQAPAFSPPTDLSRIAPTEPMSSSLRADKPVGRLSASAEPSRDGWPLKATVLGLLLIFSLGLVLLGVGLAFKRDSVDPPPARPPHYVPAEERQATVVIPPLAPYGVLRSEASFDAQKIERLPQGARIWVLSAQSIDGWLRVRTESGTVGYIHRDIVRFY